MTATSTNINIEANNMLPIDMSMAKRPLLSSGSTSSSSSSISRPPMLGDVELSVERCSDDLDESSSSSGSNSPNGKPLMVCEGERVIGYLNCNYLLKQMNKRKLHLPCPLCNSLVVNMSDHLAKTHMIVDFKQRKVLLNMVRQNHIMNPNELKQLLENNQYLLSKIRNPSQSTSSPSSSSSTSASQSVTVNRQQQQQQQQQQQVKQAPKSDTAQSHLAGLEKKLDEFIKMASMGNLTLPSTTTTSNASPTAAAVTLASLHSLLQPAKNLANSNQQSAAVLTPDQSDIDRFSEESESNNTKAESSPESCSSSETTTVHPKHDTIGDELSSLSSMQSLDDSSTTTIPNNNSNNASYLSRMKQLKNKRKSARPAPYTNENKENRRSNLPPAHLKALLQPSAILGTSQALNILPQQQQQSSQIAAPTTPTIDGEKRISELETRLNHTIKSFNVFQSGVIKQIELFFKDFQKTVEELQNVKNSMHIDNNHHRPNQLF